MGAKHLVGPMPDVASVTRELRRLADALNQLEERVTALEEHITDASRVKQQELATPKRRAG